MEEVWKDIENYEGMYQVSNFGRVKSLDRKNNVGKKIKGRVLKPISNISGYTFLHLYNKGLRRGFACHRLVAKTFIGELKDFEVDHNNQNKLDNRVENLRLTTHSGNMRNVRKKKDCSSKYRGVSWSKQNSKWVSSTHKEGNLIYFGSFDNELEAALYYDKEITKLKLEGFVTNKSLGLL